MFDEDTVGADIRPGHTYAFYNLYPHDGGLIAYSSAGVQKIADSLFHSITPADPVASASVMPTESTPCRGAEYEARR
eukprot:4787379-Prorocentrum_lima.AAC.1